jgi:hypothetical protein
MWDIRNTDIGFPSEISREIYNRIVILFLFLKTLAYSL